MKTKSTAGKAAKIRAAQDILRALGFAERQSSEMSALVLLALAVLKPKQPWAEATAPLCGITPIIAFIAQHYGVGYAPNTRETIRDEAVKFFSEAGLLLRNPDQLGRPTNSGKTVYQLEPAALAVLKIYGSETWSHSIGSYEKQRAKILVELQWQRELNRVPLVLPNGDKLTLSAGGQNPLIKSVVEEFCPRFTPGAAVVYIGDTETKFLHLDAAHLAGLGVALKASAKMPDVVVHDIRRNWLVLIEAVSSAGAVDGKRRSELKQLFKASTAGLVFVTAFESRRAMQSFLGQISWESEVWIAESPDHLIHFNGERFLGPYPDVTPSS